MLCLVALTGAIARAVSRAHGADVIARSLSRCSGIRRRVWERGKQIASTVRSTPPSVFRSYVVVVISRQAAALGVV